MNRGHAVHNINRGTLLQVEQGRALAIMAGQQAQPCHLSFATASLTVRTALVELFGLCDDTDIASSLSEATDKTISWLGFPEGPCWYWRG